MIPEWADWLAGRPGSDAIPRALLERQFDLMLGIMIEMLGPLRREAKPLWNQITEHFGRTAATRGLAAGEVVEELQHLRLLLIRHTGAQIAAMRPRRAMVIFLRLNAIIDRAVTQAVVGYTDALVASLLMTDRDGTTLTEPNHEETITTLEGFEVELAAIVARR